jgi:hypothetical protein
VEFEDTRNLGRGKLYHEVKVPWGGSLFPAYQINHSYIDCDVYVSLAKLKNHATAGVTLGMKNNFGVIPISLYGQHEPREDSTHSRAMFHDGKDRPAAGLPQEVDRTSPRRPTYRVPRHVFDAVGIRPIDLVIIDGVETVSSGEGPWVPGLAVQEPGLLLMGRNPVCTDAVATAAMGYDPTAAPGAGPFPGDNHLALAAALGLGSNDPRRIEVVGLPLGRARHPFGWQPREGQTGARILTGSGLQPARRAEAVLHPRAGLRKPRPTRSPWWPRPDRRGVLMAEVTYTTGLVVIPPASAWPPIQAIRAERDHKLRRWMPHITLAYPFLPPEELDRLAPACTALRPFELTLASFDSFRHHRDS